MIGEKELLAAVADLDAEVLQRWIDQGWVQPHRTQSNLLFDRSDVARVRLIYELHFDLSIEEESMPVVLSLMDQLYGTRRALGALMSAVQTLPDSIQAEIADAVARKS